MFGNNANTISGSLTNATAIGANAIVNSSNSIQMGDANVRLVYAGVGNTAKLITGRLQVSSGSLTAGNVLTSDGLGNAVWQTPGGGGLSNGWGLTGNAGTVDGINFIGTTDFVPLNFRVNNDIAGKIDPQYQNVLLGYKAGENFNTSSFNNNAIQNVAIGDQALYSNQNSFGNTAVGFNALYSIVGSTTSVSSGNVALGWKSLFNTRFGQDNTALGTLALYNNINSEYNTAIGKSALLLNTIGERNTGVGGWSLSNNNDGITNSGLGFRTDVAVGNLNNATSIGSYAIVNASNKIRFGDPTVNVVEGPVVYTVSDGRFKNNINETDVKGLEFIKKLRPVVYNFDTRAFESFLTQAMPDSVRNKYMDKDFTKSTAIRQSGFIAQEVEKAASDVGYDFNGVHTPENKNDNYSLSYAQFVVPLVKAVQELSTQNTTLREELAELKLMVKESLISNKSKSLNGSIKITEGEDANIAKLFQNAPNPFSQNTTIKYSIPSTAKNATLTITTLLGKQVKAYALKNNSATSVEINGGQLTAGSYIYSLIVDGTLIDSKQMILTSK